MAWPSLLDYQEAVQNPRLCFSALELKQGSIETDRFGLPKPITGSFASVYQIRSGGLRYAVRCFLHNFPDQEERYAKISRYLEQVKLPCMVGFVFIRQGILVKRQWYPILRMEWIGGHPLNDYIRNNLAHPERIRALAQKFLSVFDSLKANRIAHGDLQHGNILVINDEIRLIDYDGMFVPGLEGRTSHELGQRNYQHPQRGEHHFGSYLDHFSGLVIYLSLLALSYDTGLWHKLCGDGESLLFKKEDYEVWWNSKALQEISKIQDPTLMALVSKLAELAACADIRQLPPLPDVLKALPKQELRPIQFAPPPPKPGSAASPLGADWVISHIPITLKSISSRVWLERLSCAAFLICESFNVYARYSGLISTSMFASQAIGLIALLLFFYEQRYRALPEIRQKWIIRERVKALTRESGRLSSAVKELEIRQKDIFRDEERELIGLNRYKTEIVQKERFELLKIDSELQASLRGIQAQRDSILQLEAKQAARALSEIQKNALSSLLVRHPLAASVISGIGYELKQRLIGQGIQTAADIIGVHVFQSRYGRHVNYSTQIETLNRGRVRVEGIGAKKAQSLLNWRRSLEVKYSSMLPQSLPPSEKARIASLYQQGVAALDYQELLAKQTASKKREIAQRTRESEIAGIAAQIQRVHHNNSIKKQEMGKRLTAFQKDLAENKVLAARAERELFSYSKVTFRNYLKRIFTSK
jgi:serine/threonine protein kinase